MPAIRSGKPRAALLLGIFLLMLLGNILTPYAVAAHAQTMNGRLCAHFWAQHFSAAAESSI